MRKMEGSKKQLKKNFPKGYVCRLKGHRKMN